ncbi:two-component sensor histidine kinase, partial [Streptosporangium algeriense]
MRPGSLRWKVAALITLACCAVTAVVGVLVHRMTVDRSMGLGEGRALEAVEEVVKSYRTDAPVEEPSPWTEQIKRFEELPEPLRARLTGDEAVTWYDDGKPEQPWMWAARRVGGGLVATSMMEMSSDLLRLRDLDRAMVQAALTALAVVVPVSVGL